MATQEYHTPPERDVIHLDRDDATAAPPRIPGDVLIAGMCLGYLIATAVVVLVRLFAG